MATVRRTAAVCVPSASSSALVQQLIGMEKQERSRS